jgi:hypothetical protein
MGTGGSFPEAKAARARDHSPPTSTKVKEYMELTSIPQICIHGMVISEAQGQLYLLHHTIHAAIKRRAWQRSHATGLKYSITIHIYLLLSPIQLLPY